MLETIPKLEEEFSRLASRFIENAIRARAPAFRQISRHRVWEGRQSTIVRPNGDEDDTEFHEFSTESEISVDTILYSSLDEILQCFMPVAKAMARDHEKMLFETINQVTARTGNVVHGGQGLSYDKILEALETIQIDFDADGNPMMPTIIVGPAMEAKMRELINDPTGKDFQKRQADIIDKKRLEWCAREASRTLVG